MQTRILKKYRQWQSEGQETCLILNIRTEGSTYTKPGAILMVNENGDYEGLISGGCLENELVKIAVAQIREKKALSKIFDMRNEADDFWGSGSGCRGMMEVFFLPSTASENYLPALFLNEEKPAERFFIWIHSKQTELLGKTFSESEWLEILDSKFPKEIQASLVKASNEKSSGGGRLINAEKESVFCLTYRPPLRLLILGGGADAIPFVQIAKICDWEVTVADHRKGYLSSAIADLADHVLHVSKRDRIKPNEDFHVDAAIVKSHVLEIDRFYLETLADSDVAYIGLLGPIHRREKLLSEIGEKQNALLKRLYSPAGIEIKSYDPASIAVSVIAQIMMHFFGKHLRQP